MPIKPALDNLQTERLSLRRQRVSDAAIYRRLWIERDGRVPPHRRLDLEGRPSEADIADQIGRERKAARPGLLAVELLGSKEVVGYCGLVFGGNGSDNEPELAFELLREVHNRGYATEAGLAVVNWAHEAGYRRLWAGVWDWNGPSRRVLEKLGFRDTGQVNPESSHGRILTAVREF